MNPLLGWIEPSLRTGVQHAAHADAVGKMIAFTLPPVQTAGPVKVVLTDFWKRPEVVADIGMEFPGFHQLTGSCVGASAGNAAFTLGAVQRCIADNPTKAFVPFWPYNYGKTRFSEGDRGQGEGAVDSVMGEVLKGGVFGIAEAQGLPAFSAADGLMLTESLEMAYSDGGSSLVTKWDSLAIQHPCGSIAPLSTTENIKSSILNGYPVLDGCSYYMGTGKIVGSGANAYTRTQYDGRGGHSTCFLGYWDHPNDGPLFLYSNQWPASTYPKDPAGAGRCCAWALESEVAKLFRNGGNNGETMALSHLNYFPAQADKILDWSQIGG